MLDGKIITKLHAIENHDCYSKWDLVFRICTMQAKIKLMHEELD